MASESTAYKAYKQLAELLNSDKKENIDRAYDALAAVANENYNSGVLTENEDYEKQKNALAANKAKASRYLNRYLTDNGYSGSGVETDMKLKSELTYNSDLAELGRSNKSRLNTLLSEKNSTLSNVEAKRAEAQTAADKELADDLYKAKSDDESNELKRQELSLKKAEIDKKYGTGGTSSSSSSSSGSGSSDGGTIEAYRTELYNRLLTEFEKAKTSEEMEQLYQSVTGVNAENAESIFGASKYSSMVNKFRKEIASKKKSESYDNGVKEIVKTLRDSNDYARDFASIYKNIVASKNPKYTMEQLNTALDLYRSGIDLDYFD